MFAEQKILLAKSDHPIYMLPNMANRHGLIAGATGTGKTITMKVMAESFSDMGVPVFLSDVKGDLSGMCSAGIDSEDMRGRIEKYGLTGFEYKSYPTRFWDIWGEQGHPLRATVSDLGPAMLAKLLDLTEVQAGVLNIVFRVADDTGLDLIDMKDLRAMLQYVGDNREEYTLQYGNVSTASIGAIQRALLTYEQEGGTDVFGEPALDIRDWIRTDLQGRGYINILSASKLIHSPNVYSTFLLWMLTELYEKLPEVGDPEKPRIVFFFDEAHLLFADAKKALVQKIVQIVKLIRSKGVGVYFVTQSPSDIPDEVLAQLSNRVQHALRAYTPMEQTALRAAARAFRENAAFDTETALTELGVGEALVSFLDEKGVPGIVERAGILPPQSRMGTADQSEITQAINVSEFELKYRESVDRESAYELITRAAEQLAAEQKAEQEALEQQKRAEQEAIAAQKQAEKEALVAQRQALAAEKARQKLTMQDQLAAHQQQLKSRSQISKTAERAISSATSSVARSVSTNLINSITGGKKVSTGTMAKRAATNALSSVLRSGSQSIIRGLFGNKK